MLWWSLLWFTCTNPVRGGAQRALGRQGPWHIHLSPHYWSSGQWDPVINLHSLTASSSGTAFREELHRSGPDLLVPRVCVCQVCGTPHLAAIAQQAAKSHPYSQNSANITGRGIAGSRNVTRSTSRAPVPLVSTHLALYQALYQGFLHKTSMRRVRCSGKAPVRFSLPNPSTELVNFSF